MIYDILPVNNYQGNNSTTMFDFDFYIESEKQLKVYLYDTDSTKIELRNNIDYSINEIKNKNGSYITFPIDSSSYNILSENQKISLELDLPTSQETQYNNSSLLNLEALEYSFDYLTRLIQILKRKISLCVKVEECSDNTPEELMESINNAAISTKNCAQDAQNSKTLVQQLSQSVSENAQKVESVKSNLEETFSSLALKEDVDGKFAYTGKTIASSVVFESKERKEYDLSSYLPDDGCDYLCWFDCAVRTNTNSGSGVWMRAQTKRVNGTYGMWGSFGYVTNRVANTTSTAAGQVCILITPARAVSLYQYASFDCTVENFSLTGYRRLGENV